MRSALTALALLAALVAVSVSAPAGHAATTRSYAWLIAPNSSCPGENNAAASLTVQRKTILCLINYARRREGLRALPAQWQLNRAAQLKDKLIARCGQFSHTPCGISAFYTVFRQAGYIRGSYTVGENLEWGSGSYTAPAQVVLGWLNSPEHRANLLGRSWHEQGLAGIRLASFQGVAGVTVWASSFGARS